MAKARAVTAADVSKNFVMRGMLETLTPMAMKKSRKICGWIPRKTLPPSRNPEDLALGHGQDFFHNPSRIRKLFMLNVW